jgi:Family of unknown function (DUF6243)
MAKKRDTMLGVGGQRTTMSRRALRGDAGPGPRGGHDPRAQKKELLRAMRERAAERATSADDKA